MDAFLAKLSYHATSFAIRSCIALTSKYIVEQGSRLIKAVDDDPLRQELALLQRRLARKINLISPILESIENQYARGNSALETVVKTTTEIRDDIDMLGRRLESAIPGEGHSAEGPQEGSSAPTTKRLELLGIKADIKELITAIDDAIPLVTLWITQFGSNQPQSAPAPISPARSFQASMLLNVGDMQYVLNPTQPMQIGPDFVLSLYMLFQGHSSSNAGGEPYGLEDGQRKPIWQEVLHKARLRLYRMPPDPSIFWFGAPVEYSYQLQLVEDLDDGRVHTSEEGESQPKSYDGVPLAGIRERIPIGQIAKIFYADMGRILNIQHDDEGSSAPVLLLKRDVSALQPDNIGEDEEQQMPSDPAKPRAICEEEVSDRSSSRGSDEDDIQRQIREESEAAIERPVSSIVEPESDHSVPKQHARRPQWKFPPDLDPEWIALEVFSFEEDDDENESSEYIVEGGGDISNLLEDHKPAESPRSHRAKRTSVDSNLASQFNRMSMVTSSSASILSSSRPSSQNSYNRKSLQQQPATTASTTIATTSSTPATTTASTEGAIVQSPFSAIRTSLSLLEMLIRLASLQELEQTTHLAASDELLRFYLGEAASTTGFSTPSNRGRRGDDSSQRQQQQQQQQQRQQQQRQQEDLLRCETERKVGFDPYTD